MRPALFRRREAWTLTPLGWLLLLAVVAGAAAFAVRAAYPFLAVSAPVGGRILVAEGWMLPEEAREVAALFRRGRYERILATGGAAPAWLEQFQHISYATLAREALLRQGIPAERVTAVPTPATDLNRTYLSALAVRRWMERAGIERDALDLVSLGVHSRRSWMLYRAAFGPRVRVGIVALRPTVYDPDAWWRTSEGTKTVLSEALSWLWTALFFRPGEV
jgi:hypothetical protein